MIRVKDKFKQWKFVEKDTTIFKERIEANSDIKVAVLELDEEFYIKYMQ